MIMTMMTNDYDCNHDDGEEFVKEMGIKEVDTLRCAHCRPKSSVRLHFLHCRVLKCCNYCDGSSEEPRTDMRRQVVTQGCINLLRRGYKTL